MRTALSLLCVTAFHYPLIYRCAQPPQNGLFSVMIAILLGKSYQDLRLNSQDVSAFYLSQIYHLSAGLNGTAFALPFQVSDPSTFSPASSSIWTGALWSLSLVISLACTVIATLLRQWARQYLHITQEPRGPRNRARIRELVAQGVEKEQLQRISLALPGLFHLSVFLFLSGLAVSSHPSAVNLVIRLITFICIGLYSFASIISIPPFGIISYTPLSSFARFFWLRIVWLTYVLLYNSSLMLPFIRYRTRHRLWKSAHRHLNKTLRDTMLNVEALARKLTSSLDSSVVSRLFDSLDGHEEMEQFLLAIPGFYDSSEVKNDNSAIEELNDKILAPAIASFVDRSLASNILPPSKKQQRMIFSILAMKADPLLLQSTLRQILRTLNSDIFRRADFVRFSLGQLLMKDSDPWIKDYAQCVVAVGINRMRLDDKPWVEIVRRYLKPEHAKYRWDGHNLRLCNLIYLTQHLKKSRLENSDQFESGRIWHNTLVEARKFDAGDTAPELRYEFRILWDELLGVARDWSGSETKRQNAQRILFVLYPVNTLLPSFDGPKGPSEREQITTLPVL